MSAATFPLQICYLLSENTRSTSTPQIVNSCWESQLTAVSNCLKVQYFYAALPDTTFDENRSVLRLSWVIVFLSHFLKSAWPPRTSTSYPVERAQIFKMFLYSLGHQECNLMVNGSYMVLFYSAWALKMLYTTSITHPFTQMFSCNFLFNIHKHSHEHCSRRLEQPGIKPAFCLVALPTELQSPIDICKA